ncbi:Membrane transport protein [anaerobic digester metagenome]
MDIMVVINQMMMLFIIMMIGYAAVKLHLVDMDFQKKLSGFILQVTMPFLMISSVSGTDRSGAGETVLVTFVVAGLSYLITPLLGYLTARLLRVPRDQVRIYIFLTMFSNIAFMGFPVIHAIFGKQAMVIAIIFNLFFNVLQFTIGTSLFSGEKMKLDLNTFRSPAVIASILAIIMFVFGIELPPALQSAFQSLGGTTTPLAMLVIGISLAGIPLREIFTELRLYPFTLIKQIIIPALTFVLLKPFIQDPLILGVSVIILAMPCPTMAVIIANRYNREVGLATRAVFLTTLASVATIPLIASLLAR